ncbi:Heavy metal-associated isoprenylated plant protein 41 [Zea mays]|uniref:Heavy metal-associated isoprenylated plant protein 41 n=1 Tax=Zea mays TaxID=4577 RepID=A0A3L6E2S7_MAIZE|nr:Heavy metal-associated isoprenylated plant protein 41 [Zea mays]
MHCDAWTPTLRASVHYQSTTLPTRVHGVRGSLTTSPAVGHDSAPAANGGGSREGAGPAEEGVLGMRVVEGAPEADEEEEKWLGQYSSTQSILLVGDGDFSFSLALATGFGSGANLVATSLDTYEALGNKFCRAKSNITALKSLGATVLHGIDVKTMKLQIDLKNRRFDRIIYNFPHSGFKGKEHEVHMINSHKKLVREFFCNARRLLRPYGEIHVSHKRGKWYEKWGLKHLAAEFSLVLVEKVSFQKADYPGYHQKKGAGPNCDKPFPLGTCSTFKFRIGSSKKQNGRRAGPISSIGGDTRPCRPLSLVQPWSGLQFVPRDYIVPVPMTAPSHVVDQRQPGMPLNFVGIYSHQGSTAPSLLSTPGSSLTNALGAPGRIPSMGRISSNCLLARLGQTLNENRIIAESLGNTDYFACEYQKSLLREYRMQSQLVPEATSLSYSAFLEARQWESVQRQERLRRRIAYGRSQ